MKIALSTGILILALGASTSVYGRQDKGKDEGGAIFLTDGYFNLAILPNHETNAPNGLYHFGFEVENGENIVERMKKVNPNKLPKARPNGRPYAETRGSDPDGNYFDISEHGFSVAVPLNEKPSN